MVKTLSEPLMLRSDVSAIEARGAMIFAAASGDPLRFYAIRDIFLSYCDWLPIVSENTNTIVEVGPGRISAVALAMRMVSGSVALKYLAIEKRNSEGQFLEEFLASLGLTDYEVQIGSFSRDILAETGPFSTVVFEHSIDDIVIDELLCDGVALPWLDTLRRFDSLPPAGWKPRATLAVKQILSSIRAISENPCGPEILIHHYVGGAKRNRMLLDSEIVLALTRTAFFRTGTTLQSRTPTGFGDEIAWLSR